VTRPQPPRTARRSGARITTLVLLTLTIGVASADATPASAWPRFELAWKVVDERYWDLSRSAIDWHEARRVYGERLVADGDELDALIEAMYAAIGDDHTRYVSAAQAAEERERFGDLPCIGYFGAAPGPTASGQHGGIAASAHDDEAPPDLRAIGPVELGSWRDGVGYLRVPDLVRAGTAEGVRQAVVELERAGAIALVLDLRGNPGGRLVTMMQVAGVFTRGLLWRALTRWSLPLPYPALGTPATDLPLAVLVDADVHSAAEGLAGALQMRGRAMIVGATTAGNVEAVLPFCLRDGAQAWIATGVLAPLNGPTWEGRGVQPDVAVDPAAAARAARSALLDR
jgi:carboxyl-terminal processing protease